MTSTRILSAAVLSLFFSSSAYASVTAEQWQSQLQSEIKRIQTQSADIHAQGEVVVEESDGQLRAVLPVLTVVSPDKSQWSIPAIILQGSTSGKAVTITLPTTITRYNAAKAPIAKMTLGSQTLNGNWDFSGNAFDSLNGTVKNVSFNDAIAHSQSDVGNITIKADKGSSIQFVANDVKNTTAKDQKQLSSAVEKVTLGYELSGGNKLTLPRLIGLFNPSILLTENKEIGINATAERLSATDSNNRTTTTEKVTSNWKLQPKGKMIGASNSTKIFIVRQTPESGYSFILPQQMDLESTVSNMPLELVSFAPGMSSTMAKQALAKAGTVITIPKLAIKTFDQANITGNGSLKANADVPAGFTGRMTLKIENIKELVTTMQTQLLQPGGGNRAAKTQALMVMMMVQGMGKQNGNATEFVLDLTAEGQVLVNGQDLSGLIPKGNTQGSMPAIPVAPVTGSNI